MKDWVPKLANHIDTEVIEIYKHQFIEKYDMLNPYLRKFIESIKFWMQSTLI